MNQETIKKHAIEFVLVFCVAFLSPFVVGLDGAQLLSDVDWEWTVNAATTAGLRAAVLFAASLALRYKEKLFK